MERIKVMNRKHTYTVTDCENKIELIAKSNKEQLAKNSLICLHIYRICVLRNDISLYTIMLNKYKNVGYIKDVPPKK